MMVIGKKISGSLPVMTKAIAGRDADFIRAAAWQQNMSFFSVCGSSFYPLLRFSVF